MASASMAVSFGLRFSPLCSRPSFRVSHTSVGLASFNKVNSLKLSSSHNISGFGLNFLQKLSHISPTSQIHTPFTVFAAKGYKMKTHKASAKRFRVTGRGKIVRRRAGKQHLLYKKNAKRRLRLSKLHPVSRSDYDNVIGALPYLKNSSKGKV
ncbi:50S ribosomal protein L35 [Cucumis melo var. makuwa]|uniref:50S ribosomal protein L35 n=1 Tax=Cucumis melo var. makuwa TaxID=1194695 RepID=A0A5D3B7R7_CUCMM|nr:50S ribosomal protein L35 [Cucumis melo var. makuwa]TYJ95970.1 50S ribosomal protein L35 [Cucumis melo var. makuwa]